MFLDSFGVGETMTDVSEGIKSVVDISANPNGILEVIKNKIVIRDRTDFN